MDLIRASIQRPIAVVAVVIMAVLFGALALSRIPVQLAPDVRKPVVVVETSWPGAAPAEVEREIVNLQEDAFRGLEGLETMTSRSRTGQAEVTLEFAVGSDMGDILLLVSNRLDRVGGYPAEAGEPTLNTSGSDDSPIAWVILRAAEGNTRLMSTYGDFVEDVLKERVERVDGVSTVNVFGGVSRELQIVIRPEELARFGLTIPAVVNRLRAENISLSAGDVDEGKRRYVVRADGNLNTIAAIESVVLRSASLGTTGALGRVTVSEVADVGFSYKEPTARLRFRGEPALAFNIVREQGANVIATMEAVKEVLADLEAGPVADNNLLMEQVYDETIYIEGAIDLVTQNIWVGGLLAAMVLLLFLRSPRATLVISLAIPVSIVATFVAMAATGRTLNVISLAGIAFAVGMIVDAAIVVLENIYRLREQGKSRFEAAYEGARQVWGAILVSALTTVMVFIPILVMQLEAGQLFRDIAVAISVSVLLSLVVAVTVIPALSSRLLSGSSTKPMPLPGIDHFGRAFSWMIMAYVRLTVRFRVAGLIMVGAIATGATLAAITFLPKLEYLPEGNRNLVFGLIIPPPGYNLDTTETIAQRIEAVAEPMWQARPETELEDGTPALQSFFFVATPGNSFVGAAAVDGTRVAEVIPVLSRPIFAEPGTFGFMTQPSLFGRGVGGGRTIELNISGDELEDILSVAGQAAGLVSGLLPRSDGHQFRPIPGLELGAPEVRLLPDRVRLADAGLTTQDLAATVDAYNDGLRVAEISVGNRRLDLTLKGDEAALSGLRTQDVGDFPVVTPSGQIVPVSELAEVRVTAGPTEIRHLDRLRTVTLEIRPSDALPLEAAVELLETEVIAALEARGLPPGVRLGVSGSADALSETWNAIQINLAIALVIVFLVMAILFESFVLPLVVMISVPVAAAGGVGGLALLNLVGTQPLDMLTLLGFIILVGIVVNNAILIVHQSLYHLREDGMPPIDAIEEATRNRIRPIFMSTLTSICGMMPLVVFPGAGSELYRGLGAVVVGGLSMSAFLTLLTVPPLLRLVLSAPARDTVDPISKAAPAE
ncbi:efflux RND transporter permease subunit [Thalassobacter stenotrophicus]|uniref:Multidrug transporter MdtC n=2 Tax=Thalassobacter stenotrophicus TaxID=266809 RepID=A0A0P1F346_9RHOB|nr:efflux RND transporter permease subunit [Thalassobacter stenotrophicus]PVZ49046.1 AcrB/AcrD/AcrF family protein [Thalassobacter stenotrophicus]CUH61969.1 Multidrug transporter MdtC [Thalassobacter stenotrophicus]SHI37914.1 hydrophobic/amphiphilic exporter-1, HAE1 family [Thalassobacter stenotrophicus DSM 16310]